MSIGRPKEFDTEKAMNAAMQQFWRDGYEATSLQDLLKAMGLSKSSLYQTFGNKHALFLNCLDNYQRTMSQEMSSKLDASESGMQFIQDFLNEVIEEASANTEIKGCMLVNTMNELSQQDQKVADKALFGISSFAKVFARAIERCKQEGDIKPESDTETLVNYLITNVSGLRTMVKGGVDEKALESVSEMIQKSLK